MVNEIKVLLTNEAYELLGRYPPLHLTCDCSPLLEVLQLLLEKSTDTPWNKTSQQRYPLHGSACNCGYPTDAILALVHVGANEQPIP